MIKQKTILTVFVVSVVVGGFVFFVISSRIAALVGFNPIWKGDFNETVNLFVRYYDTSNHHLLTSDISTSEFLKDKDLSRQIQKEALSKMIDYKILTAELEKRRPDWRDLAELKIKDAFAKIKEQDKFEDSVRTIYGMEISDFKSSILLPRAQIEILSDELKKQNKTYEQWLKEERSGIDVRIMIDGLEWKEGEVAIQ